MAIGVYEPEVYELDIYEEDSDSVGWTILVETRYRVYVIDVEARVYGLEATWIRF